MQRLHAVQRTSPYLSGTDQLKDRLWLGASDPSTNLCATKPLVSG